MTLGGRVPPGEMGAVEAMATHLGMDPRRDKELLWIAREALHAPRPSGWSEVHGEAGNVYYVEQATGRTSWWLPTDDEFRRLYQRKRAQRADVEPAVRPASGAASLPSAGPWRSVSARRESDRGKDRDGNDIGRLSAVTARGPRSVSGRCSAGGDSGRGGSARSVVAPGSELRPSGAVLLPLSPQQRLRAEFWASVGAAPAQRHKPGVSGSVAQWHESLVARVKNRLAVREQEANLVAGHTARARARREEARTRSREIGREIAPPRRDRALSSATLQALGTKPETHMRQLEETETQLRQAEVDRWRDENTKLELQAQDLAKSTAQRRDAVAALESRLGGTAGGGYRAQQAAARVEKDRMDTKRRAETLNRAMLAEKRSSELEEVNAGFVNTIGELREHRKIFLATARAIEARIERLAGETPHLRAFCESALSTRDRLVRQLNKLTDELNAQIRQHRMAMLSVADDDHEEQSRLDSYRVHEGDVGEAARRNEYLRLRSSRHEAERNAVRYGALRSQLESWVAEFQKVVRGSSREVPLTLGAPGDVQWARLVARQAVEECRTNERRNTSMLSHLQRVLEPQQAALSRELEVLFRELGAAEAEGGAARGAVEAARSEADGEAARRKGRAALLEFERAEAGLRRVEASLEEMGKRMWRVGSWMHTGEGEQAGVAGDKGEAGGESDGGDGGLGSERGSAQDWGGEGEAAEAGEEQAAGEGMGAGEGTEVGEGSTPGAPQLEALARSAAAARGAPAIAAHAAVGRLMSIHTSVDALISLASRLRAVRGGSLHTTSPRLERWLDSFGRRPAAEGWLSGRERLRVTCKAVGRLTVDGEDDQAGEMMAQTMLEDFAEAARAEARTEAEEGGKAAGAAAGGPQKQKPGDPAPRAAAGGNGGPGGAAGTAPASPDVDTRPAAAGSGGGVSAAAAAAGALPAIA